MANPAPQGAKFNVAYTQPEKRRTGINYIPRWLGGVSCYIAFGLGGLLSSLTVLPLLRFWPGTPEARIIRVQKAVHFMFKGFVAMLTWAGVVKVSTHNAEQLHSAKGVIVISNHPSLVDVVVLISLMPNAGCIVKQGLWRNPFLRGVVSCAGYIPNRGAELMLEDCREVLARGTNLIIFPEGTRTVFGSIINEFARGAANIAIRTQADILPVVLRTNVRGLTKEQPWYEIPRQTMGMAVEIGNPIPHQAYQAPLGEHAKMARQLTRDLEQYYQQQLENNYDFTQRN
ncbi:lysophospholipid acyltransferase family protein [Shewanella xiamenensis]|uniref:lysophospholipid acyltransferase family protein n=1 Tax=Shewanella xiamenensis TaxID=332186 RepID=UPI000DB8A035|nr:lysophospholipid acyltransferase family protein [Shewanella xiamenensis]PZP29525.1 MAG: 1-acyl-sn-glycerol-3-phosphate acyltransferase [Shewanella oneidensis]MBW0279850.1 1-acyl-sn-glycerol-3-phosphate acyltransferase [Shewanella xiamenensis]MCT8864293.1 1-acyl-sn-glycerol-3-phosphate acyltransferase [Shewanella xiamenensis]MCT8872358.1 1-acyl-sn-glycerol-3-phosphate acyltransferase [Shewanella xiamenensis]MCT8876279.1 1-acyl-sn-glycerol-3-phosphate acyltransferase [Shewanella xiamenensis]